MEVRAIFSLCSSQGLCPRGQGSVHAGRAGRGGSACGALDVLVE